MIKETELCLKHQRHQNMSYFIAKLARKRYSLGKILKLTEVSEDDRIRLGFRRISITYSMRNERFPSPSFLLNARFTPRSKTKWLSSIDLTTIFVSFKG